MHTHANMYNIHIHMCVQQVREREREGGGDNMHKGGKASKMETQTEGDRDDEQSNARKPLTSSEARHVGTFEVCTLLHVLHANPNSARTSLRNQ